MEDTKKTNQYVKCRVVLRDGGELIVRRDVAHIALARLFDRNWVDVASAGDGRWDVVVYGPALDPMSTDYAIHGQVDAYSIYGEFGDVHSIDTKQVPAC